MHSTPLPKGLEIVSSIESGAVVLSVSGELDIATAAKLESEIDAKLANAPSALYVDLSAVDFMDSTGLRILIRAERQISETGGSFGVVTGESPARRVIELTGMNEHLRTVRSLDELTEA